MSDEMYNRRLAALDRAQQAYLGGGQPIPFPETIIEAAEKYLNFLLNGTTPIPPTAKKKSRKAAGGIARAQKLSPGRRSEIATTAAKRRWAQEGTVDL